MDSLDDKAAARVDAFIERLRIYGNRMQGKFVKKLSAEIFELRVKQFDRIFRVLSFYQPGMLIVGSPEENPEDPTSRDRQSGEAAQTLAEIQESVHGIGKGTRGDFAGVRDMKRDRHHEIVEERRRKSASYGKSFTRTLQQIDLALLVREMREESGLTQAELAKKAKTTQSVIARLEDAEYNGHSLAMLERIAAACGVALKLRAAKRPDFEREVALV